MQIGEFRLKSEDEEKRCFLCDSTKNIEEHHIDWHHKSNIAGNKMYLCKRCHTELHKVGYLSRLELEKIRKKVKVSKKIVKIRQIC